MVICYTAVDSKYHFRHFSGIQITILLGDTIINSKNVQVALEGCCVRIVRILKRTLNCSGQTINRNLGFEDLARKGSK